MRKMWMVMMAVGLISGGTALAQWDDDAGMDMGGDGGGKKAKKEKKVKKEKKPKAPKAPLAELTLEGKITKAEKKGRASYTLTTADGAKVRLPTPRKKKKKGAEADEGAVNLEDYVDADVTVIGQGSQSERKGKKRISLKTITSITKKDAMM